MKSMAKPFAEFPSIFAQAPRKSKSISKEDLREKNKMKRNYTMLTRVIFVKRKGKTLSCLHFTNQILFSSLKNSAK
jgi:hypothetical protein